MDALRAAGLAPCSGDKAFSHAVKPCSSQGLAGGAGITGPGASISQKLFSIKIHYSWTLLRAGLGLYG